jgi:hypothetical protein
LLKTKMQKPKAKPNLEQKRSRTWTEHAKILSNGHSPQIHQNGELLVRMCQGESHFSQKWRMLNVSKCIESGEMVGECRANVSNPGKMVGQCRANVSSPTKTGWQMLAQAR